MLSGGLAYQYSAHAPLNRDDGGLLPEAYLHLVKRSIFSMLCNMRSKLIPTDHIYIHK